MIIPFFLSLLMYTVYDYFKKREIGKWLLLVLAGILVWFGQVADLTLDLVASWFLLHYVIHQTFWGVLNGDPFYLDVEDSLFDKFICFVTGRAKWLYAITLAASLFVGMDLLFKTLQ